MRSYIFSYTQKTLLGLDLESLDYVPDLLTELPTSSDDNKTFYFELRDDIKWDNGEQLTGEDIAFSTKIMLCHLTNNSQIRPIYNSVIKSVNLDANNPLKFSMDAQDINWTAKTILGGIYIQQQSYWDPNGLFDNITFDQILIRSFTETDELSNWFNDFNHADNGYKPENLKGLGPYSVSEWAPSQYVTLLRKDNWWGSKDSSLENQAYPEKIIFKIIKEDASSYLALKNQEIDYDIILFATDPQTPSILLEDNKGYKEVQNKELIGSSGKVTAFFKNPVRWKSNKNENYDSSFRFLFSNNNPQEFEKSSQNAKRNISDYIPGYIQVYPEGAAQRKMGNKENLDKLILFTKNFSYQKNSSSLSNVKDEIISLLSNHIENIDDLVNTVFLTPKDLNEKFYFPKGNIDHMTLTNNQNFNKKTFSTNPDTEFYKYFNHDDVFYCGAGSFPCGSVAGTPGYMCSKQIIKKYN